MAVDPPWICLTCEDGYQFIVLTKIAAPVEAADLGQAPPSPSKQLGTIELALFADDDDDGTPSDQALLPGRVLCSVGSDLLVSTDEEATAALAQVLLPDCELLRGVDQLDRPIDVFHPIAFAPVIDMEASRVLRRGDEARTIREVRDLVFDPAAGVGHHVVRDPRIPRRGVRYSPEAVALIEELSGGAVCRLDVSWW